MAGRPRKYQSDAEKQAAYRDRKRRRNTVIEAKPIITEETQAAPESEPPKRTGYIYLKIGNPEKGIGGRIMIPAKLADLERYKAKGWIEISEDEYNALERKD